MLKYSCIIFIFCLVSCEKGAYFSYTIDNKTSYSICLITKNTDYQGVTTSKDTVLIQAYTNTKLRTTDLVPDDSFEYVSMSKYDTVYISKNDTLMISKLVNKKENWELKSRKPFLNANRYDYTFLITNDDLKKR